MVKFSDEYTIQLENRVWSWSSMWRNKMIRILQSIMDLDSVVLIGIIVCFTTTFEQKEVSSPD